MALSALQIELSEILASGAFDKDKKLGQSDDEVSVREYCCEKLTSFSDSEFSRKINLGEESVAECFGERGSQARVTSAEAIVREGTRVSGLSRVVNSSTLSKLSK